MRAQQPQLQVSEWVARRRAAAASRGRRVPTSAPPRRGSVVQTTTTTDDHRLILDRRIADCPLSADQSLLPSTDRHLITTTTPANIISVKQELMFSTVSVCLSVC